MRDLGYTPRQETSNRRQKPIAVIVPDIRNPFFSELIHWVGLQAAHHGYPLIITNAEDPDRGVEEVESLFRYRALSGVLVATGALPDASLALLIKNKIPAVLIARDLDTSMISSVVTDDELGGRLVARHLLKCHPQRWAILTETMRWRSSRARLDGFSEVRLNTRATGVRHRLDGRYEVTVQSQLQSAGQVEVLTADAVVVTIPAFAAATVLTSLNVDSGLLSSIRYVSTATVTLGYAGNVLPPEMTASGFVVPPGEKRVLTACTFVSNKWPHAVRNGHTLIRCYLGRDGDESSVHWNDEQMEEAVRGDLRQILGINAAPETVLISRWMDAMPQYDVGHLNRIKEIDRQVAGYPGLVLAGAAYRGVGIPDCVVDATRAAENVLAYLSSAN
jgi:hypothetical protein